ncbi:MAG TPA: solute carrier family 23 protein [Burkholderiales bacterium]|nr:solute carrier family 23 protein [Burkholderiales bacterium]HSF22097.1 solute carrier family 23 protein [Burkholderiales bacterium]
MRKPPGIVYGVDERPPLVIVGLSGAQHVGLMSINLIYPVLIAREAGVSPEMVTQVVSLSMLVLALGAVLQALTRGPVGSGFLCQPVPTAAYLLPSLLAAREGGLALVFGMTVAAGLFEAVLARGLRHLRPWFPPEISGLVILMIGMTTAAVGMRMLLGIGAPAPLDATHAMVAAMSLGTMMALVVWTKGALRLFCVLIGMATGYLATALLGGFSPDDMMRLDTASVLALPGLEHAGWSFSWGLAIPFAVAALAAAFKATGNVITCQKLNDADWRRPDMGTISRGVLADGLATVSAGVIGTTGVNSATMNVGLASATGILSRHVAYAVAGFLVLLAFFPKLGAVLNLMPPAVAGSALLFAASFIIVNGFEIMTSRLLDARKTFMIGLSFIAALAVDFYPTVFRELPASIAPVIGSSIVLGTLCALLLNLLFRIGVRTTRSLVLEPGNVDAVAVEGFMEAQGAAWGARRDVIDRASFNLTQSIETIVEGCNPEGALTIEASFDEFNLDVRVSYSGPPLELPEKRPTNEEIMESDEGQRKLAGFMLRRQADRVAATHKAGRSTILFHFDH